MSEAVGFVLVFALVVTTVGIVYAVGMSGLQDARDVERVNNAVRAFDVLADNVDDVARRGAPSRATEVKLADAQLSFGDPVVLNVSGVRADDPSDNFTAEYRTRPIVYRAGTDTAVVYAAGTVIREQPRGSRLVRAPAFVLGEERVVLPLIQVRSRDEGIGGSKTVLIRTIHSTTDPVAIRSGAAYDLTINVTTPRAAAWRAYMSDSPDVTCPPARNTPTVASCDVTTERLSIAVVRIDASFD